MALGRQFFGGGGSGGLSQAAVEALIATGAATTEDLEELKGEVAPLDTDGALAANSDVLVASQKATKTYVDAEQTRAKAAELAVRAASLAAVPNVVFPALNPMGYIGNAFVPLEKVPILARFIIPKTGILKSLSCFPKTSSGNVAMGIYDTGDAAAGKRTLLYQSGSVAVGTASKWQVVAAAPNLNVKVGQQVDVMAVFDSNTVELGRWAMLSGNEAVLPEGWNVVPGGTSPKMNGTIAAIASIAALPETINEASITTTANLPAFAFRIE
jgi:hypothetical protein